MDVLGDARYGAMLSDVYTECPGKTKQLIGTDCRKIGDYICGVHNLLGA
jgi:hypothetical protein